MDSLSLYRPEKALGYALGINSGSDGTRARESGRCLFNNRVGSHSGLHFRVSGRQRTFIIGDSYKELATCVDTRSQIDSAFGRLWTSWGKNKLT